MHPIKSICDKLPLITVEKHEIDEMFGAISFAEATANAFKNDIAYISLVLKNIPYLNNRIPLDFGAFYTALDLAIADIKTLRTILDYETINDSKAFDILPAKYANISAMFSLIIGTFMSLHSIALQVFPLIEESLAIKNLEFTVTDFEKILSERYAFINSIYFKAAAMRFHSWISWGVWLPAISEPEETRH
jgi:hypothetical protein